MNDEKIGIDEALTPEEAAKFLNINVDRLRYLRNQGRIRGVKIGYNTTLYRLADLRQADIEERQRGRKKSIDKTNT